MFEIATKNLTQINPCLEKVSYVSAKFLDHNFMVMSTDLYCEFLQVRIYDFHSHTFVGEPLTKDISWDITLFDISADRKYLAFVSNQEGISALYNMNLSNHVKTKINEEGVITALAW